LLLAKVFNTPGVPNPKDQFIDITLSPSAVCHAISEWIYTFTTEINTEFILIHNSIKNTL